MGSADKLTQLRQSGRLNARERVDALFDPGTFRELGLLAHSQSAALAGRTPADGLITGYGEVDGRRVYVGSEDVSVLAGTRGRVAENKLARIRDLALRHECAFVSLMEAGASRFQEVNGVEVVLTGTRFRDHLRMSGHVPQVSAMFGACFGGPAFAAAQSDFVTSVSPGGFLGMSGPAVVKVGVGEEISAEDLGGVDKVARTTGQVDFVAASDRECIESIRTWLSYFPSSSHSVPPQRGRSGAAKVDSHEDSQRIDAFIPDNPRRAYDMATVLGMITDGGELFMYRKTFGPNLITAWARIDGHVVGIVANNPMHLAGAIDFKAATKARKFVDLCDAFHIPLIFFTDCPGFLVGSAVEKDAMVHAASRLVNVVGSATVPKITVVVRKAIGMAYIAMCGRSLGPDFLVAWPTARFDLMGPAAGVELVHGRAIVKAENPDELRSSLLAQAEVDSHVYRAAGKAYVDDVVLPSETRAFLIHALQGTRSLLKGGFKHRIDP